MNSSNNDYEKDPRTACQYGAKCYQKNQQHLEKYKHPTVQNKKETPPPKKPVGNPANMKQAKLNVFFKKITPSNSDQQKNGDQRERTPKRSNDEEQNESFSKKNKAEEMSSVSGDIKEKLDLEENEAEEMQESEKTTSEKRVIEENTSKEFEFNEQDCRRVIKKLFLVDMPEDFFSFWSFCRKLSPKNVTEALESIDVLLVGPFDVLSGSLKDEAEDTRFLRHWRYYYDPPEFQTVIKCRGPSLMHLGYYRDEPDKLPVFVASNCAAKDATITPVGENLFAALDWYIRQFERSCTPFKKSKCADIKSKLAAWAKTHDYSLSTNSDKMRERNKNVVARTLHHAGIVVPYDKKTELGYRPLSESQSNLVKLLDQIKSSKNDDEKQAYFGKLHEIVNWANIAMDEGDFGTCLELGIDLFCNGSHHLHKMILQQLTSAYDLLGRNTFSKIIKAHLEDRKKGDNLSVLRKH